LAISFVRLIIDPMTDTLKVFLCHSSNDKLVVSDLYQKLVALGIDAWINEEKLLPGVEWKNEISKAVKNADVIIICLSKSSITEEGYIQKEINLALDTADEKPEGTLFIIPAMLEEYDVPTRLSKWQWVNLFHKDGYQKLIRALKKRAETLGRNPLKEIHPRSMSEQQWGNIEFVWVKEGNFLIGSKNDNQLASYWEKPQRIFSLPYDFFISRYPITNTQYSQFILENHLKLKKETQNDLQTKPEHPAVYVSWRNATKFCDWLKLRYGTELPKNMRFRLPTEVEWEKAARGPFGSEWPWGDKWKTGLCNSNESGLNTTTPVKYHSPNGDSPYGVVDMAGNVWEWTLSLWGVSQEKSDFEYPYNPKDDRKEIKAGYNVLRVLRGGSFQDSYQYVRCLSRRGGYPLMGWPSSGFRVVCSVSK
jgi:formylglycine-generating enzyme required for sulfatase activity